MTPVCAVRPIGKRGHSDRVETGPARNAGPSAWSALALTGLLMLVSTHLTACSSTSIGNPEQEARAHTAFQGYDSQAGALTLSTGVELDEAWISFESVQLMFLDTDGTCSVQQSPSPADSIVVDLLDPTTYPEIPVVERDAPAELCRVEIQVGPVDPADLPMGAPMQLVDNSVALIGASADDIPLTITGAFSETITLDAIDSAGINVTEGDTHFVVGFALETWIDTSLLDSLLDPLLGLTELVADETTHPDLVGALQTSLDPSAAMFVDGNADGQLDSSELNDPVAR